MKIVQFPEQQQPQKDLYELSYQILDLIYTYQYELNLIEVLGVIENVRLEVINEVYE